VSDRPEGDVRPPETDVLFKAQMAFADVALAYWKHAFGGVLVLLVGAFAYGQWQDHQRAVAKEQFDAIGKAAAAGVDTNPMALLAAPTPETLAARAAAAEQLVVLAGTSQGAAAVEAYLEAAEAYRETGKADARLDALAKAHALGGEGVVAYGASSAYAHALVDSGKFDEAVAVWRARAGATGGFYAEQALLDLARAQLAADRKDEARRTVEEFKVRFGTTRAAAVKALEEDLGIVSASPASSAPAVTAEPAPVEAPAPAPSGSGG
jgi:hypothetical protein